MSCHLTFYLKPILFTAIAAILISCGTSEESAEESDSVYAGDYEHQYYSITDTLDEDRELDDLIRPYINKVRDEMDRVLVTNENSAERGRPEGALGNYVADILRSRASGERGHRIHIAVTNNDGLRSSLPAGEITVGMIYELMPFENTIVIQKHSGDQILKMADQIAEAGGEAISGMRMQISDDQASGVMIGSERVDPDQEYWVATNSWIADGGGPISALHDPVERHDLDVLVRYAIIDYLNSRSSVSPETDHRIRS